MGNCLKTQLKESVNNDNLLKLGEIRVEVLDATKFKLNHNRKNVPVRANSAVLYYLDSNGDKTGSAFASGYVSTDEHPYGIGVDNNYQGSVFVKFDYNSQDITIDAGKADLSSLLTNRSISSANTDGGMRIEKYPSISHQINITKCASNTDLLPFVSVLDEGANSVYIEPSPGSVILDVSKFIQNKPNISSFGIFDFTCINMSETGYADFGKLALLVSLNHNNKYSWTIEDFVANKRNAGVSSGTVTLRYGNDSSNGGVCSFNGQKLTGSPATITWDASTINVTY